MHQSDGSRTVKSSSFLSELGVGFVAWFRRIDHQGNHCLSHQVGAKRHGSDFEQLRLDGRVQAVAFKVSATMAAFANQSFAGGMEGNQLDVFRKFRSHFHQHALGRVKGSRVGVVNVVLVHFVCQQD